MLSKVLHAGIFCVIVEVGDDLDDDSRSAFNDCMAATCFGLPDNLAGLDGIAEVDRQRLGLHSADIVNVDSQQNSYRLRQGEDYRCCANSRCQIARAVVG